MQICWKLVKTDKVNFDYSKEGFASRLKSIKEAYDSGLFDLEECKGFRESEFKELLSRNQTNRMSLIAILLSSLVCVSFFIIGFVIKQSTFYYTGMVVFILFGYNFINSLKNNKEITSGDRQEIIDYLYHKNLISLQESETLHKKIIDKLVINP